MNSHFVYPLCMFEHHQFLIGSCFFFKGVVLSTVVDLTRSSQPGFLILQDSRGPDLPLVPAALNERPIVEKVQWEGQGEPG